MSGLGGISCQGGGDRSHFPLEILCLNLRLDDVTPCPTTKKPFDVLNEGLFVQSSRGDRTPIELFRRGAASIEPCIRHLILILDRGTRPPLQIGS